MLRTILGAATVALLFGGATAAASTDRLLSGAAAFTSWMDDAPGVTRLIRPEDLPAPFATKSAGNPPGNVDRPAGVTPKVPDGFKVSLFAEGLSRPRVIRRAPNGDLFVAESGANAIRVFRPADVAAKPATGEIFADGLDRPYGIAFYPPGPHPKWLYVANEASVVRFPYENGATKAAGAPETVIEGLPVGYHWTRDIAFSPDGATLYLSIGSGSNVAEDVAGEPGEGIAAFAAAHAPGAMWGDELDRASVLAFDPDGKNRRVVATGIRNCSGLAIEPATGLPWCVTNERDGLGDDLPPDYATRVRDGGFYGWPWYYIGAHEDPRKPLAGQRPDLAARVIVPDVLFQAHSAPLGIAFNDGSNFPEEMAGDAFVALHGSWNRGKRTGYKVVRLLRDASGQPTGAYEDFATGFVLSAAQVWGRPVGVAFGKDGSLFVTEDASGTIWRVSRDGAAE